MERKKILEKAGFVFFLCCINLFFVYDVFIQNHHDFFEMLITLLIPGNLIFIGGLLGKDRVSCIGGGIFLLGINYLIIKNEKYPALVLWLGVPFAGFLRIYFARRKVEKESVDK